MPEFACQVDLEPDAVLRTHKPETTKNKYPMSGTWACEAKRFYDGAIVEVEDSGAWQPRNPRSKLWRTAEFWSEAITQTEWKLTEKRSDEVLRYWHLSANLDDKQVTTSLTAVYMNEDGTLNNQIKFTLMPTAPLDQRHNMFEVLQRRAKTPNREFDWSSLTMSKVLSNVAILVSHDWFDAFVGVVILVNSVLIGVEIDAAIRDEHVKWIGQLEYCFLAFYILELILRLLARLPPSDTPGELMDQMRENVATASYRDFVAAVGEWKWIGLDIVLVLMGIFSLFSVRFFLDQIMIFRILRLLRVVRAIRTVDFLQPLWKLVSGLGGAIATLSCTILVIAFILYIFACIGGEVIAQNTGLKNSDDAIIKDLMQENFSSMSRIMLTLVQFTTADITDIYFPLVTEQPWLSLYFGMAYLVITILLMNLVTAVLVEDAIARSAEDATMKQRRLRKKLNQYIPELKRIFEQIDHDDTGDISMEELLEWEVPAGLQVSDDVKEVLKAENLESAYECFDADNSGLVSQEEFIEGGLAVLLKDAPQETTQLLQLVRSGNKQLKSIQDRLGQIEDRFTVSE